MGVLSGLEPQIVFNYFEEISKIPRGSHNTKAVSDFLAYFAKKNELKYRQDELGNVIIFVPATAGYEDKKSVILQGHMDMVCEKTTDSKHDFLKDPLDIAVMDDEIFARGTTLGGDDGIALAYGMAASVDKSFPHPALEIIFTIDEEVGMDGAIGLDTSDLKARYMLNLDSEDEGIIVTSSAGGLKATMSVPVKYRKMSGEEYKIIISGLSGGHSGIEIDKYNANAVILMGRLLHFLKANNVDFHICGLDGGLMDNAIPRDADCDVIISEDSVDSFEGLISEFENTVKNEYRANEHNIMIYCDHIGTSEKEVLRKKHEERVIFLLNTVPDGVQKVSQEPATKGLVETSLNNGIMRLTEKDFYLHASLRSSISSAKAALSDKLRYLTETIGGTYTTSGEYPAWEYNDESYLLNVATDVFKEQYGRDPEVIGIHAGVECGIFYEKIPGLDIISIGPDMKGVHTPLEKLYIGSVKRTWEYIKGILSAI
ncbi:MAG: aminoacyl-histidine dipeptidase [Lachnospiraceae bacterium]|nr:aminoacyl-histidine dipeptidase [Lachnospiraceae bacterium]